VATWDEREDERRSGLRLAPAPYRSLASFTAALQVGEPAALRALFHFYAPLLRDQARRFGLEPEERAELVTTVLDDFVLHVLESGHPPRDVSRYLVAAVRNRIRNHRRDRLRRHMRAAGAATTLDGTEQRIVAESHSEYSLRAVTAPDMEMDGRAPLESAIVKLARWSAAELRADELALMVGVGHHVPLRDIAEQLEISCGLSPLLHGTEASSGQWGHTHAFHGLHRPSISGAEDGAWLRCWDGGGRSIRVVPTSVEVANAPQEA
jgi:hypothetical protein